MIVHQVIFSILAHNSVNEFLISISHSPSVQDTPASQPLVSVSVAIGHGPSSQVLVLVSAPIPQVTEQEDQEDQLLQTEMKWNCTI